MLRGEVTEGDEHGGVDSEAIIEEGPHDLFDGRDVVVRELGGFAVIDGELSGLAICWLRPRVW